MGRYVVFRITEGSPVKEPVADFNTVEEAERFLENYRWSAMVIDMETYDPVLVKIDGKIMRT